MSDISGSRAIGERLGPLLIALADTVAVVRPGQRAQYGELGSLTIEW